MRAVILIKIQVPIVLIKFFFIPLLMVWLRRSIIAMTRYCLGRGHKKIILLWFLLSYHAVLFAAPQYPNDSTSSTLIPSVTADDSKKSYLLAFGTIKANDPELSA